CADERSCDPPRRPGLPARGLGRGGAFRRRPGRAVEGRSARGLAQVTVNRATGTGAGPAGGGGQGGGFFLWLTSTSRSKSGGVRSVTRSGSVRQFHIGRSARSAGPAAGGNGFLRRLKSRR